MVMPGNLSDETLVKMAQQGNREAFTSLYQRYFPTVYKRVRYTIPEADVEDITQEIFLATLRSLKYYRGEALFRTWLRTLVQRQIADFYRRRKPAEKDMLALEDDPDEDELAFTIAAPDDNSIDDQIVLRQALRSLPDHYREVLLLRVVEGLPFQLIANLNNHSLEATKSLFRRAVMALQGRLERIGYEG
jgi:RNA polymerase sigma-70 factor (ECF subfamily)